jgi:hypothetical protein
VLFLFLLLLLLFILLAFLILLMHLALLPLLRPSRHQVVSLNLFNNLFHLDRIVGNGIPSFLFFTLDLEHGVFIQEGKILALVVGDLFLEHVLELLTGMRVGFFLAG